MVFFTCNSCGESLKKNKVEKHIGQCPRFHTVSCIDCSQDFTRSSYNQHIKCISEDVKYGGVNYVPKDNKGEVKQNLWIEQVQKVISNVKTDAKLSALLEKLIEYPNIPRKEKKFVNFVKNSINVKNDELTRSLWQLLSKEIFSKKPAENEPSKEQSNGMINGSAESACSKLDISAETSQQDADVTNGGGKKEKRKKKKKEKQEKGSEELESADVSALQENKDVDTMVGEEKLDTKEEKKKKKKEKKRQKRMEDEQEKNRDEKQNHEDKTQKSVTSNLYANFQSGGLLPSTVPEETKVVNIEQLDKKKKKKKAAENTTSCISLENDCNTVSEGDHNREEIEAVKEVVSIENIATIVTSEENNDVSVEKKKKKLKNRSKSAQAANGDAKVTNVPMVADDLSSSNADMNLTTNGEKPNEDQSMVVVASNEAEITDIILPQPTDDTDVKLRKKKSKKKKKKKLDDDDDKCKEPTEFDSAKNHNVGEKSEVVAMNGGGERIKHGKNDVLESKGKEDIISDIGVIDTVGDNDAVISEAGPANGSEDTGGSKKKKTKKDKKRKGSEVKTSEGAECEAAATPVKQAKMSPPATEAEAGTGANHTIAPVSSAFSWEQAILTLLERADGHEMVYKKLKKKVLRQYRAGAEGTGGNDGEQMLQKWLIAMPKITYEECAKRVKLNC